MPTRSVELHPTAPYDFALALAYMRTSPSAVVEVLEGDCYRRAFRLGEHDVALTLRSVGTVAAPRLVLEVTGPAVDATTVDLAAAHITRVLRLDADPTPFLRLAAHDPVLQGVVDRFPGVRPLLIGEPFEALLWAIIGQQINITFARKLKGRLVDLCGRTLEVDGQSLALLPTPATVALLDPGLLTANQFSRQKTAYLILAAGTVARGDLDLTALSALPEEEAVARLTQLKGVGRWTAEYVLMRGLGAPDSIPAADVGLRAIIGRAYGLGRHASEAEVREIALRWAGWRSWAAFHWWLALQLEGLP